MKPEVAAMHSLTSKTPRLVLFCWLFTLVTACQQLPDTYETSDYMLPYCVADGQCGFMSTDGKLITQAIYASTKEAYDGFGIYSRTKNGLNGLLDGKGNEIFDAEYRTIFVSDEYYGLTDPSGFSQCISRRTGRPVFPVKIRFSPCKLKNPLTIFRGKGGEGIISSDGRLIAPPEYYDVTNINGNMFNNDSSGDYFKLQKDSLADSKDRELNEQLINRSGEVLGQNTRVSFPSDEGFFLSCSEFFSDCAMGHVSEPGVLSFKTKGFLRWSAVTKKEPLPFYLNYTSTNEDRRCGYINSQGEELLAPVHRECLPFSGTKHAAFKSADNKWAFIDSQLEVVSDARYDHIERVSEHDGLFVVRTGDEHRLLDIDLKSVIDGEYDDIYFFSYIENAKFFVVERNDLSQIVRFDNYALSDEFYNDISVEKHVGADDAPIFIYETPEGKIGAWDENGNTILPPEFSSIDTFENGPYLAVEKHDKECVFAMDGTMLVPCEFLRIDNYVKYSTNGDLFEVSTDWNKTGLYNPKDSSTNLGPYRELLNIGYRDEPVNFYKTVAKDNHGTYYSVIDESSNPLWTGKWAEIEYRISSGLFRLRARNGKEGVRDITDTSILPAIYDRVHISYDDAEDTTIKVRLDNKYGLMDASGQLILPIEYDNIRSLSGGYVSVVKDGKTYSATMDGRTIMPRTQ